MTDTLQFNMRMRTNLKAQLDQAATLDRRSTASLVDVILSGWLEGREYRASFDQTAMQPPAPGEALRRAPGRPRADQKPKAYTGNLKPIVEPWLKGRERVSLDAIIAETGIEEQPATRVVLRELLIELGWIEFVNEAGGRVWKEQVAEIAQ